MRLLIRESPNMFRGEAPKEVPVHRREVFDAIHRKDTTTTEKHDPPDGANGDATAAPAQ